ncbi:MAG: MFS transporter [Actinomycetota bacterium]
MTSANEHDASLDEHSPSSFEGPLPSRGARAFRALKHREFRRIWSTFIVGQFGFWIAFIAMQALMSRLTDTDGRWLGLLFFCNFSPMLFFTPIAGVVADRVDRRRILLATYSTMTVLMSGCAAMALAGNLTPVRLLPFAFGIGTIFSFNAPASQAVVAHSVPHSDLPSAISLQAGGAQSARVVGPTLAAPVLALWSEGVAFVAYAVASAIVVVMLSRMRFTAYEPEADGARFFQRLKRGFQHARERPPALAALSVLAMSSLFAASYLALLPVMANDVFDKGPTGFATLAAVAGLGSMIGALTTAFRDQMPTLRSTALLVAAFGASVAIFGVIPTWTGAYVMSVLVGVCYFSAMTTLNTLVQSLTDENMRGRISSLFVIGWAGLVPIGGLWQGAFAGTYGVQKTMLLAGTITTVYALLVALLRGNKEAPRAALEVSTT